MTRVLFLCDVLLIRYRAATLMLCLFVLIFFILLWSIVDYPQ